MERKRCADPAMLADSEITFRTTAVAYGAEALAELVMTDHYIGFLPEHYMATRVEEGAVRALMPERFVLERPFKIILKKGRIVGTLIESFVDVLEPASTQA